MTSTVQQDYSRQVERRVLRGCGELAVKMFFDKLNHRLPRKTRRLMGRVYGNAAYAAGVRGKYVGATTKYSKYVPHPALVSFVQREAKKLLYPEPKDVPIQEPVLELP